MALLNFLLVLRSFLLLVPLLEGQVLLLGLDVLGLLGERDVSNGLEVLVARGIALPLSALGIGPESRGLVRPVYEAVEP